MNNQISRRTFLRSALASGAVAAGAVLAGCSGSSDTSEGTASSDAITKVTLVSSGNGLPYSLLGSDGSWTGIDADIWEQIKSDTGIELTVKQAEFSAMFGELDAGRANLVANCLAVKPERTEKYLASNPYYGDAQGVAVAPDNTTINTFDDLAGKTCGVTSGQASETIARQMAEDLGFTITTYEESNAGMSDLLLGRIDAMFTTDTVVYQFNDANSVTCRILDERTASNNVAYFFPKTDEGQRYCDFVNAEIDKMLEDGRMSQIITEWMHSDMTTLINHDED
jgi:ABC-type amino acid transport substrate-binding protein